MFEDQGRVMRAISGKCVARAATGLASASVFVWSAIGAERAPAPIFGPNGTTGWIAASSEFIPPPSGPGPVILDPAVLDKGQTFDPNTMFRVADLTNPNLKPWVVEELKKANDRVHAGKPVFNSQAICWPKGVPNFLTYPIEPVYFVQTPKEVLMIWQNDQQVRHVYMNVPHSEHVVPSWYGESVGHYENGDTLVVDTIGLNTKTWIDNYRTPHTDQLHVVERFKLLDGGDAIEVNFTVDDPGAFNVPWSAMQRYRKSSQGSMLEEPCAENNINPFHQDIEPMPEANNPDF